jgi:hypothetical protein
VETSSPRPLCSSRRSRSAPKPSEALHDLGHELVGLLDSAPGLINEPRLDVFPATLEVRALVLRQERGGFRREIAGRAGLIARRWPIGFAIGVVLDRGAILVLLDRAAILGLADRSAILGVLVARDLARAQTL